MGFCEHTYKLSTSIKITFPDMLKNFKIFKEDHGVCEFSYYKQVLVSNCVTQI
jgi:hypothetical protein